VSRRENRIVSEYVIDESVHHQPWTKIIVGDGRSCHLLYIIRMNSATQNIRRYSEREKKLGPQNEISFHALTGSASNACTVFGWNILQNELEKNCSRNVAHDWQKRNKNIHTSSMYMLETIKKPGYAVYQYTS